MNSLRPQMCMMAVLRTGIPYSGRQPVGMYPSIKCKSDPQLVDILTRKMAVVTIWLANETTSMPRPYSVYPTAAHNCRVVK